MKEKHVEIEIVTGIPELEAKLTKLQMLRTKMLMTVSELEEIASRYGVKIKVK